MELTTVIVLLGGIIIIQFLVMYAMYASLVRYKAAKEILDEDNEELEKSNDSYEMYFTELKTRLKESNERLRAIDVSGHFEADDEVGFFFKELKNIWTRLYELGVIDEEKIEEEAQGITTEKLEEIISKRKRNIGGTITRSP